MKAISTVYFSAPVKAGAAKLADEISRLFPEAAELVRSPATTGGPDNVLKVGDTIIAILDFDRPQPMDSLEQAFKVNFTWSESRQVIGQHRAHVVLAVMKEVQGFDTILDSVKALTMATLALAHLH